MGLSLHAQAGHQPTPPTSQITFFGTKISDPIASRQHRRDEPQQAAWRKASTGWRCSITRWPAVEAWKLRGTHDPATCIRPPWANQAWNWSDLDLTWQAQRACRAGTHKKNIIPHFPNYYCVWFNSIDIKHLNQIQGLGDWFQHWYDT